MGMSWIICVKNASFSMSGSGDIQGYAKKDCNLINNLVFEDENLITWLGLTEADQSTMYSQKYLQLTIDQVQLALDTLTNLVDQVNTMYADGTYTVGETTYTKTQICDLVDTVIREDYHFGFPWDGDSNIGVPKMIQALKDVIKYMKNNPDDEVVLFLGEAIADGKHNWLYMKADMWVQDSTMRA